LVVTRKKGEGMKKTEGEKGKGRKGRRRGRRRREKGGVGSREEGSEKV
jgi:hypothetical protein